ncbi:MAG: hypothetical protein JJU33_10455 [Phycisphaerales bacterium]|nr:hypothetical protein [Phycisphaerales bacterium]
MNSEDQRIFQQKLDAVCTGFGELPETVPEREPWFASKHYPVTVAALRGICYQVYRTAMAEAIQVASEGKYYPLAFSVRPLLESSLRVLWSVQKPERDYAIVIEAKKSRDRLAKRFAAISSSPVEGSCRPEFDRFIDDYKLDACPGKSPNMMTVIRELAKHDRDGGYDPTLFYNTWGIENGDNPIELYYREHFEPLHEVTHMVPVGKDAAIKSGGLWTERALGFRDFLQGLHESVYCWRRSFGPDDVDSHASMAGEHWRLYHEAEKV